MLSAGMIVLLAALVCLGYGLLGLRLLQRMRPAFMDAVTIGDAALIGYMLIAIFAIVANFFLPLSSMLAMTVCLGSLISLPLGYRLVAVQTGPFRRYALSSALFLALLCFYFGGLIPGSTSAHYDTGLYHLQVIRQIMEYPMILGTANIHMRFGYNSSLFPAAAILSGGVFGLAGVVTSNALLVSFVTLAIVQRSMAWIGRNGSRATVFGLLVIGVAAFTPILSLRSWAGTPNTDIPSSLMILYGFYLALHVSDLHEEAMPSKEIGPTTILLMATLAFAVSLKLSAAPIVLLFAMPMLAWWRNRVSTQDLMLGFIGFMAIGLPWLARGVGTSGCVAYPLPLSCLPVPWRIARGVAQSDLDWMRAWARNPATSPRIVLADWAWFPEWLASLGKEPATPAFICLALALSLCVMARSFFPAIVTPGDPQTPQRSADFVFLLAGAFAAITFWFFSAPLVRYGASWLVLPLLLLITYFVPIGFRHGGRLPMLEQGLLVVRGPAFNITLVLVLATLAVDEAVRQPPDRLSTIEFFQIPQVEVQSLGIHAGIPIFVPARGDQCWDAPRICTPHLRDGVSFSPFLWTWVVAHPRDEAK